MKVRATGDLRAHPPEVVGHRLAHPAIPRSVDRRPPWQVACRLRLRRAGGQGTRAGGRCAKDRAPARGKKLNLIIAALLVPAEGNTLGFLVNSETRHREELQPNLGHSGAKAVRVRATGAPRAHPQGVGLEWGTAGASFTV